MIDRLAIAETIRFFRSYGVKSDEKLIEEWFNVTSLTDSNYQACEIALYDFNNWCMRLGTAYEEGIDDQTRIARLLKEVNGLRDKISLLEREKELLEELLGIPSF